MFSLEFQWCREILLSFTSVILQARDIVVKFSSKQRKSFEHHILYISMLEKPYNILYLYGHLESRQAWQSASFSYDSYNSATRFVKCINYVTNFVSQNNRTYHFRQIDSILFPFFNPLSQMSVSSQQWSTFSFCFIEMTFI